MHLIVDVEHLPFEGKTLEYSKSAEDFAVLRELTENGECRFIGPLAIELTVVPERKLIKVDGVITGTVAQACSRCLEEYQSQLSRRFTLRFSQEPSEEIQSSETGIELSLEHIGLSFFKGEAIDFTDTVQEQVVLGLPYKPLCREECKGLCPRCGADLNKENCSCAQSPKSNPFAVLKNRSWPARQQEKS